MEDSNKGEQQAAQDPKLEEDREPELEQDKEAELIMEAAAEQGQGHGPASGNQWRLCQVWIQSAE